MIEFGFDAKILPPKCDQPKLSVPSISIEVLDPCYKTSRRLSKTTPQISNWAKDTSQVNLQKYTPTTLVMMVSFLKALNLIDGTSRSWIKAALDWMDFVTLYYS